MRPLVIPMILHLPCNTTWRSLSPRLACLTTGLRGTTILWLPLLSGTKMAHRWKHVGYFPSYTVTLTKPVCPISNPLHNLQHSSCPHIVQKVGDSIQGDSGPHNVGHTPWKLPQLDECISTLLETTWVGRRTHLFTKHIENRHAAEDNTGAELVLHDQSKCSVWGYHDQNLCRSVSRSAEKHVHSYSLTGMK